MRSPGPADGTSEQPAQTVMSFPDGRSDCIVYSGMVATRDAVGIKLSPYLAADPSARSRRRARLLAGIGARERAAAHLRYVAPLRSWSSVKAYSPALSDS
jgi:uncharacterized protein CbrC (UPF0167 family)